MSCPFSAGTSTPSPPTCSEEDELPLLGRPLAAGHRCLQEDPSRCMYRLRYGGAGARVYGTHINVALMTDRVVSIAEENI